MTPIKTGLLIFAVLLLVTLFMPLPAGAFSGTEGASFLDIPVGGRPAALGAAYSAQASDAYAPLYNPGGLGLLHTTQLSGIHVSYLDSINYEYATFVHPFTEGHSIGASIQYFNLGSTIGRDVNGNETGEFNGHFAAYSLAYGHHIGDKLGLGMTAKFIESKIEVEHASAFAFDVGALYRPTPRLAFAAVADNMGTKLTFINQGDSLPLSFHLGATTDLGRHWVTMVEGLYAQTMLIGVRGGLEWNPFDALSLRGGYRTETTSHVSPWSGVTAGIGLHVFGQEFDYAWVPLGDLGTTHYFSLVLKFTRAERGSRNLIHYKREHGVGEPDDESVSFEPPLIDLDPNVQRAQTSGSADSPAAPTQ